MAKNLLKSVMCLALFFLGACAGLPENSGESVADELTDDLSSPSSDTAATASEDKTEDELDDFGNDEKPAAKTEEAAEPKDEVAKSEDSALEDEFNQEEDQAMAQEPVQEPTPESLEPSPEPSMEPSVQVTGINYLSSANGGSIEIKTSGPVKYKTRANAELNQFVVEIENAQLSEQLKRPFIMKDFEGAFGSINAYQNPGGQIARIVVQMKEAGEPVLSQEGSTILLTPAGSSPAATQSVATNAEDNAAENEDGGTDAESYDTKEARKSEKVLGARTLDEFLTGSGQFFGRPISIQTNDADIRDIISFIAEESGVNIVISDDVDGKVSLKLRQVPWDQALVIVMRAKSLGYVRQGNVLRITKLSTLQSEAKSAKEIVDAQQKLTPIKVKVIPVSYASVTDLEKQVKPFLSPDRGQVVSDARTSAIIITDTADVLMRVERLVKELDIPPAQVMIEGKIVEASEAFTRRVGVNWSLSGNAIDLASAGGINGTPLTLKPGFGVSNVDATQALAQNGFLSLRVGTLDFLGNLNANLSLAQADSLVRIISSPRIVTMNKEKAEISQKGETITIQTSQSTTGANTDSTRKVERTPVELRLTVTPQITAEGSVVLDVDLLRQFAGAVVDSNSGARPVNSRAAKTKVLVPNGQTAVIGGIYQSDE